MHRYDRLHAQQLHRLGSAFRAHRVKVSDRQKGDIEFAQLGDQGHVAENVSVTGKIDRESVLELDHEAARFATVDEVAVLGDAA